jgi:hypothetical protein
MSDETTKKDGTGTKRKAASRTKDDWLRSTRILVENSGIGTEIGAALQPFGYTATRLAEGRTLLDEAEALTLKQKSEYGQRYEATEAMSRAWKNADDAYLRDPRIARILLVLRRRHSPDFAKIIHIATMAHTLAFFVRLSNLKWSTIICAASFLEISPSS